MYYFFYTEGPNFPSHCSPQAVLESWSISHYSKRIPFQERPPYQVEKKKEMGATEVVCQKRGFAARSSSCEVSRSEV